MNLTRPAPKVVNLRPLMAKKLALPIPTSPAPSESLAVPSMNARDLVSIASQIAPAPEINLPPLRILPATEMTMAEAPSVASYGPDRTPLTPPILQGEFAEAPSPAPSSAPATWQQKAKTFYAQHKVPIIVGGAGLGILLLLLLAAGTKEKKHARRR